MNANAIAIATKFLHSEGISETREEMWRRLATWREHVTFKDALTAAAAIISGDYNVESADCLNEMKNFYFCGGLN